MAKPKYGAQMIVRRNRIGIWYFIWHFCIVVAHSFFDPEYSMATEATAYAYFLLCFALTINF